MFEINDLIGMGITKNIEDENTFLILCDAIHSVTMCGDSTEYENIIIEAIDNGYEVQVCCLIKQIWNYENELIKSLRNKGAIK